MPATRIDAGLQLRSLLKSDGEVEISVSLRPTPEPADDEVVVRVEAAPLNPSDIGLLLAGGDFSAAEVVREGETSSVTSRAPSGALRAMAGRLDLGLSVGIEGAGVVVRAGASATSQALLGRTVTLMPGGMYAQYRTVKAGDCFPLPDGVTSDEAAACHVNPLTALGLVSTMRREGHAAMVHTAAASNLGQMLVKICRQDGVPLVNIVRSAAQAELLRALGATYVCDSSAPGFLVELTAAIAETGATIAFDAVGGGKLAGQILSAMERAILAKSPVGDLYGSRIHKQVYIYGGLDLRATEVVRTFGLAWGIGGWLLFPFLERIGPSEVRKLLGRVTAEATTTFASHYTRAISLHDLLDPAVIAHYTRRATGEKFLVRPWLED